MGREKRGGEKRRKDRRIGRGKSRIRRKNTSVFPGNTYFIGEVLSISRTENKLSFWLSNYLSHSEFNFFIFLRPGIPKLPTWVGTLGLKLLSPQPVEWLATQTPATPGRLILQFAFPQLPPSGHSPPHVCSILWQPLAKHCSPSASIAKTTQFHEP